MNTADLLQLDDRCYRSAFWAREWERNRMRPLDILRQSVDEALTEKCDDPGQDAGDRVMTLFSLHTIEVSQNDLYGCGLHYASLADILTTVLRSGSPWERPADVTLGHQVWMSGAFLEPSGTRLRRVLIVDRLTPERLEAEKHSWRQMGELCAYQMPVRMTICVIGQQREGRHTSPWSKGWLHPVGNQTLRFKKRDGSGLTGAGWKPVLRETADQISREKWIECMQADGVMADVMMDVEIHVPAKEVVSKVRKLAEKKLERILSTKQIPDPHPSQCDWPVPCQFRDACWQFTTPSERLGFLKVPGADQAS